MRNKRGPRCSIVRYLEQLEDAHLCTRLTNHSCPLSTATDQRARVRRTNESDRMPRSREVAITVQDRSKSKPARVKEEAQRKHKRSHELSEPLPSDRKRKADDSDLPPKKRKHLLDIGNQFAHDDRSRGRIVVSNESGCETASKALTPMPSPQISSLVPGPGIISKGVSSGQYIASDKRLHNQTGQDMAQRSAARRQTEANAKASKASAPTSTSSEEKERTPSRLHLYDEEEAALRQRLHQLKKLIEAEKKAAKEAAIRHRLHLRKLIEAEKKAVMQEKEAAAEESSVTVEDPWDTASDSHSAYSMAQRAKAKANTETSSQSKPAREPERAREERSVASKASASPAFSPALPNEPPPLLAFNGNRPHQHSNAWRGQHSRHEPDWRDRREHLDVAGGPMMPSGRPLDFLIDDLGRSGEPRDISWEVLPGDYAEKAAPGAFYINDCARHWDMQGRQPDMPPEEQTRPHDEHQSQGHQDVNFHDDWHDGIDTFAEYLNYNGSPADMDFEGQYCGAVEHNMFDQFANQDQEPWLDGEDLQRQHTDRWLGEEAYLDYGKPEEAAPVPVYDLRAAVQPTPAEMVDFWKPQPFY